MTLATLGKLGQFAANAARHRFIGVGTVWWTIDIAANAVVPQITLALADLVVAKSIVTSLFTFDATLSKRVQLIGY
jgi:hypothetical protein